ncbi:hypothetical protein CBR_g52748 [Chara braunii]|uniref:Pre-mRNA-splicing factor SLU7 n=1 Tax=Chara braunii TaxID=69332 RepID=A0A388MB39_CHABU|nr:hypothetical protein CBR_g52748 [Chara braunii]|eukprot:GBG91669.1 hypothetical protein CBR_g52748 [Chara braunii]
MATASAAFKSREDHRKQMELEEARKAGLAPAELDEDGREINPHIPQYMSSAPWYLNAQRPSLKHQRKWKSDPNYTKDWYDRGAKTFKAEKFRKGACTNCGAMTHTAKLCMERPRKIGARWTNTHIAADEKIEVFELDYDGKRDRWNGYDASTYGRVIDTFMKREEARQRYVKEQELKKKFSSNPSTTATPSLASAVSGGGSNTTSSPNKSGSSNCSGGVDISVSAAAQRVGAATAAVVGSSLTDDRKELVKRVAGIDLDEDSSDSDQEVMQDEARVDESKQMDFAKVEKRVRTTGGGSTGTVRNLRIREDTAKYLINLDVHSAHYDPKTRSMREDPNPDGDPNEKFYAGDNVYRNNGQALEFKRLNVHAWEAFEKGQDIHLQGAPSQAELLFKEFNVKKEKLKQLTKKSILERYGNAADNDRLPDALLLGQTERCTEYDRAGRVIKGQDKSIPKSKYEEDVLINNHTTVWGSWWCPSKGWGYKCCKQTYRNSYCTGQAGLALAESANNNYVPASTTNQISHLTQTKDATLANHHSSSAVPTLAANRGNGSIVGGSSKSLRPPPEQCTGNISQPHSTHGDADTITVTMPTTLPSSEKRDDEDNINDNGDNLKIRGPNHSYNQGDDQSTRSQTQCGRCGVGNPCDQDPVVLAECEFVPPRAAIESSTNAKFDNRKLRQALQEEEERESEDEGGGLPPPATAAAAAYSIAAAERRGGGGGGVHYGGGGGGEGVENGGGGGIARMTSAPGGGKTPRAEAALMLPDATWLDDVTTQKEDGNQGDNDEESPAFRSVHIGERGGALVRDGHDQKEKDGSNQGQDSDYPSTGASSLPVRNATTAPAKLLTPAFPSPPDPSSPPSPPSAVSTPADSTRPLSATTLNPFPPPIPANPSAGSNFHAPSIGSLPSDPGGGGQTPASPSPAVTPTTPRPPPNASTTPPAIATPRTSPPSKIAGILKNVQNIADRRAAHPTLGRPLSYQEKLLHKIDPSSVVSTPLSLDVQALQSGKRRLSPHLSPPSEDENSPATPRHRPPASARRAADTDAVDSLPTPRKGSYTSRPGLLSPTKSGPRQGSKTGDEDVTPGQRDDKRSVEDLSSTTASSLPATAVNAENAAESPEQSKGQTATRHASLPTAIPMRISPPPITLPEADEILARAGVNTTTTTTTTTSPPSTLLSFKQRSAKVETPRTDSPKLGESSDPLSASGDGGAPAASAIAGGQDVDGGPHKEDGGGKWPATPSAETEQNSEKGQGRRVSISTELGVAEREGRGGDHKRGSSRLGHWTAARLGMGQAASAKRRPKEKGKDKASAADQKDARITDRIIKSTSYLHLDEMTLPVGQIEMKVQRSAGGQAAQMAAVDLSRPEDYINLGIREAQTIMKSYYMIDLHNLCTLVWQLDRGTRSATVAEEAKWMTEIMIVIFIGSKPAQRYLGRHHILPILMTKACSVRDDVQIRTAALEVVAISCRDCRLNQERLREGGCIRKFGALLSDLEEEVRKRAAMGMFFLLYNNSANQNRALGIMELEEHLRLIAVSDDWGKWKRNFAKDLMELLDFHIPESSTGPDDTITPALPP